MSGRLFLVPLAFFKGLQQYFLFLFGHRGQPVERPFHGLSGKFDEHRWEIDRFDLVPFSQDDGVLHAVFQFPYVSRPRVIQDQSQRFGTEIMNGFMLFFAEKS
jgi:hypothetical protein